MPRSSQAGSPKGVAAKEEKKTLSEGGEGAAERRSIWVCPDGHVSDQPGPCLARRSGHPADAHVYHSPPRPETIAVEVVRASVLDGALQREQGLREALEVIARFAANPTEPLSEACDEIAKVATAALSTGGRPVELVAKSGKGRELIREVVEHMGEVDPTKQVLAAALRGSRDKGEELAVMDFFAKLRGSGAGQEEAEPLVGATTPICDTCMGLPTQPFSNGGGRWWLCEEHHPDWLRGSGGGND